MSTEQRARRLLLETELFDELGIGRLATNARMVARGALELADQLAAERSARIVLQAQLEECQNLLGERAFDSLITPEAVAGFEAIDFGPGPSA